MNNIIQGFVTGGAVSKRRIVKFSADGTVVQASAATDLLVGVSTELDSPSGGRCDVVLGGVTEVDFGGTVARGSLITADANGKAVACAPTAGNKAQAIGMALLTQADGDVGYALIFRSQVTTPA